ncbi:MAG: hypothetical protein K2K97_10850 [Muribaculaceae bacterium]|nr:hypothetical protein [Muribaculaceae bacterium]
MKRIFFMAAVGGLCLAGNAATLRVNNAANTAAEFNNVDAALEAAQDGDVIIIEPSSTSYGNFYVRKKVTIKGGGYLLDVNDISYEGAAASQADDITVYAAGTTITGMECNNITLAPGANNVIITRNHIKKEISLGGTFGYDYTDENAITGTIIHQNLLFYITGPQYGAQPTGLQITNNILPYSYGAETLVMRIRNSVIKYNTYGSDSACAFRWVNNCVFENNLGGQPEKAEGKDNTFRNNHPGGDANLYKGTKTSQLYVPDSQFKDVDATISTEHGAFAGETPYVLSGVPAGPVIIDLDLPTAVEKGEELKVAVTIGTQK